MSTTVATKMTNSLAAQSSDEPAVNDQQGRESRAPAYRICNRCIMDTSDPDITFDESGTCNHCRAASHLLKEPPRGLSIEEKEQQLQSLVSEIKQSGKNKKYDCIIGVSGGADSTFVAYKVKKLGLRPLAVHFDNGWNSELAQKNVENILKTFGIDLFTYVVDWDEFRNLQLSFLRASTPDSEVPTDHAIVSLLFQMAAKHGVKYILAGTNLNTESIMPHAWSYGHFDWKYLRTIQKRFGNCRLKTFPKRTLLDSLYFQLYRKIRFISILDYMDYVKSDAIQILEKEAGWRNYGGKHYESIYTKFFQAYILPQKFGFDKRRAHLSSMICAGQVSREKALQEMEKPLYDEKQLEEDVEYVVKKFGIDQKEFERIMNLPAKRFSDYPSYHNTAYIQMMRRVYKKLRRLFG